MKVVRELNVLALFRAVNIAFLPRHDISVQVRLEQCQRNRSLLQKRRIHVNEGACVEQSVRGSRDYQMHLIARSIRSFHSSLSLPELPGMSHTQKSASAVNPPAVAANDAHIHQSTAAAPASNAHKNSTRMTNTCTNDVRYIHNTHLSDTGSHLRR